MPLKHSVKEVQLKNGAKGVIVRVPGATVFSYELMFRAGNDYVRNLSIQQTAHLLEHLAFNGTKKYPSAEEFSQIFTENGAYNNAATYNLGVSYYGLSAAFEAERIIELQEMALSQPMFSEDALEREKRTVKEELTGNLTNYNRVLGLRVSKALNIDKVTDEDKIETIDRITLDDINEHYLRTHTTNNMNFIISATDDEEATKNILTAMEKIALPQGEKLKIKKYKAKKNNAPIYIKNDEVKNVYMQFSIILNREISQREAYILRALTHVLTGTLHSRILGKARKDGICYHINSGVGTYETGISELGFSTQTTPENRQAVHDLIIRELNEVRHNGISEKELASVKKYYFGNHQLTGQTVGALTNYYTHIFEDKKTIPLDDLPQIINSISNDDIKNILNEFIESGIWALGELGSVTKKESQEAYDNFSKNLFDKNKVGS